MRIQAQSSSTETQPIDTETSAQTDAQIVTTDQLYKQTNTHQLFSGLRTRSRSALVRLKSRRRRVSLRAPSICGTTGTRNLMKETYCLRTRTCRTCRFRTATACRSFSARLSTAFSGETPKRGSRCFSFPRHLRPT
jgi:hypothetical protein